MVLFKIYIDNAAVVHSNIWALKITHMIKISIIGQSSRNIEYKEHKF